MAETSIRLKSVAPIRSVDGGFVRLRWSGQDGEIVNVDMTMGDLVGIVQTFMEFRIQSGVERALPPPSRQTETPATGHALLIASQIDVVVFDDRSCALQLDTQTGVALQIALKPELAGFLLEKLGTRLQRF